MTIADINSMQDYKINAPLDVHQYAPNAHMYWIPYNMILNLIGGIAPITSVRSIAKVLSMTQSAHAGMAVADAARSTPTHSTCRGKRIVVKKSIIASDMKPGLRISGAAPHLVRRGTDATGRGAKSGWQIAPLAIP